jgi:DNA-binding transcriptional ArsR family regulator
METMGRILRVQFLAENLIRQTLRVYGLGLRSFDVLATLRRSGPPYRLTPTRLYRELALTSGAITHHLDALERAGLIERVSDPHDRRSSPGPFEERPDRVTPCIPSRQQEHRVRGILFQERRELLDIEPFPGFQITIQDLPLLIVRGSGFL